MQTLLATSPMLLMQGVNDALNGDFRAWRTMLNFAYNPRGLAALDAFLARLEENAANIPLCGTADLPTDPNSPPPAVGDDSAEATTVETSQNATMPAAGVGSTIATTARVVRDLRRSAAKSHTPAPPTPRCGVEVSYKYTPPLPKQGQGPCADRSQGQGPCGDRSQGQGPCADKNPATNETTASQSPAAAEPAQPASTATMEPSPVPRPESAPSNSAPVPSPGPPASASFPAAEIAALVERARKLTPTEFAQAAFNGEFGLVKLALSEGADPNSRDDVYGVSALSAAAANGKIEVMRLLLRRGADVHARDNQGRTPLVHARHWNHPAAVELLLEAGAR